MDKIYEKKDLKCELNDSEARRKDKNANISALQKSLMKNMVKLSIRLNYTHMEWGRKT